MIEIINSIHRFLGYLDISPKYLNRAYTVVSIIPTGIILNIIFNFYEKGMWIKFTTYSLIFIVLAYFIVLNTLYYFFDKNVKWDITQLFTKYLPDEVFNIQEELLNLDEITGDTLEITYVSNYNHLLSKHIEYLIESQAIETNDISNQDGYLIPKNMLYPYYTIEPDIIDSHKYIIKIGNSFETLEPIGYVVSDYAFKSLGLFILGGNFKLDSIEYKENFKLELKINFEETKEQLMIECLANELTEHYDLNDPDLTIKKEL